MFAGNTVVLQALLLLGVSTTGAVADCNWLPAISVRLPPSIANSSSSSSSSSSSAAWTTPASGWDFGYWYQTNSSNPNTMLRNLQYSTLPLNSSDPAGPRTDLSSFQVPGNDTVFTSYGVDTPNPSAPAAYVYAGAGLLQGATSTLEILAWGFDCRGTGYRISYSSYTAMTQTPASVDVLAREPIGLDAGTLGAIRSALKALGNANITALVNAMVPGPQDDAREGMPRIYECDAYCQTNEDLLSLL